MHIKNYGLQEFQLVMFYVTSFYAVIVAHHFYLLVLVLGEENAGSLSVFVDILLEQFRTLTTELLAKDIYKDDFQRWYMKSEIGQKLRQASSAVCMLNELIYGLSDQSLGMFLQLFKKSSARRTRTTYHNNQLRACAQHNGVTNEREIWGFNEQKGTKDNILHCIGSVLHEYISPEVWDLPTEKDAKLDLAELNIPLHFFRDTTSLHKVITFWYLYLFGISYLLKF